MVFYYHMKRFWNLQDDVLILLETVHQLQNQPLFLKQLRDTGTKDGLAGA